MTPFFLFLGSDLSLEATPLAASPFFPFSLKRQSKKKETSYTSKHLFPHNNKRLCFRDCRKKPLFINKNRDTESFSNLKIRCKYTMLCVVIFHPKECQKMLI